MYMYRSFSNWMQCKSTLSAHFPMNVFDWRFQTALFQKMHCHQQLIWNEYVGVVFFFFSILFYFDSIIPFNCAAYKSSNNKNTNIQIRKYCRVIDWFSVKTQDVNPKHWKFHEIHLMLLEPSNHSIGHINVNHFHCGEYENDSMLSLFRFIRDGECVRERQREKQFEIHFIHCAQC